MSSHSTLREQIPPLSMAIGQADTTTTTPGDSYFTWDVFLMGGLSIILCGLFWALMDKGANPATVAGLAMGFSFVANYPHFSSSYILLYSDFRKKIFHNKRYFWAAVIAPLLLISFLSYAMISLNQNVMSYLITTMFALVGWHYAKQVFGCVIVTSAQRKIYLSKFERSTIWVNLISIWLAQLVRYHTGAGNFDFYGIPYGSMQLPVALLYVVYAIAGCTFIMILIQQAQRYVRFGTKPSPPAVAAFLAIYIWNLPVFSHLGFGYLIPFFHSIQYLAFVSRYKQNRVIDEIKNLSGAEYRGAWLKRIVGFSAAAITLGLLFFEFLPNGLDYLQLLPYRAMGIAPFMVCFQLFINIHHYFIDNVIWRSDNALVKRYLFQNEKGRAIHGPLEHSHLIIESDHGAFGLNGVSKLLSK